MAEKFRKAMEEGKWDPSLVDQEELAKSQATLVYGQMNEPPGARASVALSGLTVAEEFRDHGGQDGEAADIMFFIDNIFRFTQAGSEVFLRCSGGYAFSRRLSANFGF